MFEIKVIKDALSIDRVEKQWPVRFLFLFIFIIEVFSLLYPPGNQDLRIALDWYADVIETIQTSDPALLDLSSLMTMPPDVMQNFVFAVFILIKFFFYLLLIFFSAGLYIGERKKILPAKMLLQYLRRLPWLLIFLIAICVLLFIFMLITVIIPFLSIIALLIIPFLFLAANLIIIDGKNPVDAWRYSVRYSRGKRFWLLSKFLVIYFLYYLTANVLFIFVSSNPIGAAMIGSALLAYFICAIGRLSGIYYYKVNVSDLFT